MKAALGKLLPAARIASSGIVNADAVFNSAFFQESPASPLLHSRGHTRSRTQSRSAHEPKDTEDNRDCRARAHRAARGDREGRCDRRSVRERLCRHDHGGGLVSQAIRSPRRRSASRPDAGDAFSRDLHLRSIGARGTQAHWHQHQPARARGKRRLPAERRLDVGEPAAPVLDAVRAGRLQTTPGSPRYYSCTKAAFGRAAYQDRTYSARSLVNTAGNATTVFASGSCSLDRRGCGLAPRPKIPDAGSSAETRSTGPSPAAPPTASAQRKGRSPCAPASTSAEPTSKPP